MFSALRQHWPEYLIEAWALGTFMISAVCFTALLEHPASPVHQFVASGFLRRALIGLAMGVTAIVLIYSPWGQRSGAHMNPAFGGEGGTQKGIFLLGATLDWKPTRNSLVRFEYRDVRSPLQYGYGG